MFKSTRSKLALAASGIFGASVANAADYTALTTSVTTAIGEAEAVGLALMAVSLVAALGISLGKKFIKAGAR